MTIAEINRIAYRFVCHDEPIPPLTDNEAEQVRQAIALMRQGGGF